MVKDPTKKPELFDVLNSSINSDKLYIEAKLNSLNTKMNMVINPIAFKIYKD